MTYFPTLSESINKCPGCGRWFQYGYINCLVLHPPGTCCHLGDTEVSAPKGPR